MTHALKLGDVCKYDSLLNGSSHCREGRAVVRVEDGALVARDTYWDATWGSGGKELTAAELETATFLFNLEDVEYVQNEHIWKTYLPEDRYILTAQKGHRVRYFVRKGAQPDLSTKIENARRDVTDAESALDIAKAHLESRKARLHDLLTQQG